MQEKISPQEALVKPRVISPLTGDPILLEDLALSHAQRDGVRLEIVGGAGCGKSTALAHLASLPEADRFFLLDDADQDTTFCSPPNRLLIYTTRVGLDRAAQRCVLASWSEDELIEYLLRRYPDRCTSVMSRYHDDPDQQLLQGNPELICMVADQMAASNEIGIKTAFHRGLDSYIPNDHVRHHVRSYATAVLLDKDVAAGQAEFLHSHSTLMRLLNARSVRVAFAADHLAATLKRKPRTLRERLPFDLIETIADRVRTDDALIDQLRRRISKSTWSNVAMDASILYLVDDQWRPNPSTSKNLTGGYFSAAKWNGLDIRRAHLQRADLRRAQLQDANLHASILKAARLQLSHLDNVRLTHSNCSQANFSKASLAGANLENSRFVGCDFSLARLTGVSAQNAEFQGANLTGADLSDGDFQECDFRTAILSGADLSHASLRNAKLNGVDFRTTVLDGADFHEAILKRCNFEDTHVTDTCFSQADLRGAFLSGSVMPAVEMPQARLFQAGLADIDWPGANLRGADLRNCSFHFGSTRCGIVGSPFPSHGTRTGFYTDDFDDHTFKTPEEVRKANLSSADLRGANVLETDFYLVDLRGAQYDEEQYEHFARCDAILEDWS